VTVSQDNTNILDEGKVAVIDNQIDVNTGTIKLKATFPNADLRLWPGQFVNARLLLNVRKGSIVVPDPVIQRGPEGAFVFVIKDDQTVEVRAVKVASQSGSQVGQGETVIADGLRPGERVVVDGQYKLQAGSRVKMADAAAKPDSQKPKAAGTPKTDTRSKAKS
jgi:multidrug efflux system membrane fusion protein